MFFTLSSLLPFTPPNIEWWFLFCILTFFEKPEDYVRETVCCTA
ncbi:Uncharacterized protein dnl_10180 [Desulfonema limicola]|uniref:Uncharacterized protein n=1 Tax=Desulfonema limicola TaxID=45656 RepID=A0A975B4T3_9BACT|nr:Uncharacterized protein dnl_10180 [Desulfonema limicola]